MNKLFAITSAILLAGSMATSASAQSRDDQGYRGYQGYSNGYQGYQGYSNGGDQGDDEGDDQNNDQGDDQGDDDSRYNHDGYGDDAYGQSDDGYGDSQRHAQYDRDTRRGEYRDDHRDRRLAHGNGHDRRDFGHSHKAGHRYQAGRYMGPRGYRDSRWNVGTRLPAGYYGSSHYLDPRSYGLSYPTPGYRWNRVGSDAYMVSTSNGLIRDVIYSLFR